jgi:carboxymethylenebutenolidase
VTERELNIAMRDGTAQAFLYCPDEAKDYPGILFLTDLFGIRPANQAMAKRLAAKGYAVLMPNVFYRYAKIPLLDFEFVMGEERSMKVMGELFQAVTARQMGPDGAAYADFLLAQPHVRGPRIGVVGYCFTGAMALRTAAQIPDKIAAMAAFHGGRLVTDDADSPHLLLPNVKARLYFGHAAEDSSMTADNIKTLEAALAAWGERRGAEESHAGGKVPTRQYENAGGNFGLAGGKVPTRQYESETYQGVRHGWTLPGRPIYDEAQAEVAFGKLTELMQETL